MIQILPPQNPGYWINQRALTFSENDLENPNRVAVSLVSGSVIMAYERGVIDYAVDGNFQKWVLKGYSTRLVKNDAHNIYARLNRNEKDALIVFSVNNYNLDGSITTVTGKDEDGNDITETSEPSETYWYVKIGELTATSGTSLRELTYDSGLLSTDKGNSTSDLNDMWELLGGMNPLIHAKYWLSSFTVKGFIKLIGSLVFQNSKGVEKPIVDIKRSIDDNQTVSISDETIPTTAWVESRTEDRFLKKYEPDETQHRIKFFDGVECGEFVEGPLKALGGSGTRFDGEGYGEMNGLRLREFLEVPELRFNRIDVVSGILWNSIAFGLIETVDETNQRCTLKLEDGERSGLHVNDICMGIFSDFGNGTVEGVFDPETGEVLDPGDDENGLPKMYGFSTCYFSPTAILQNDAGIFEFEYMLQSGTSVHPKPSMKFAVYGNFFDKSRQASAYSTRTYKRYLNNVDTWVINPSKNIYAQFGKLDGLNISGQQMTGYGSYQHNTYFSGVQIQFDKEWMDALQGQDAYSVQLSDNVGLIRMDSEGNLRADEYLPMNVVSGGDNVVSQENNVVTSGYLLQTRIQAFKGETELVYADTPDEGCFAVSFSPTGCVAEIANGVISVSEITSLEYSYIVISVSCEGNVTIERTYQIKVVKDGVAAIYADLSNEMDAIACTPEGLYLYGLPVTTTVSMWNGTNRLSLDSITLDLPEGVVAESDNATGEITVTEVSDNSPRVLPIGILVQATHAGETHARSLTFTLNKLVQGDAGALYKLVVSDTSVKFQRGELEVVKPISAKALEYNGKEVSEFEELPDNMNMTVSAGETGETDYVYGTEVQVASGYENVIFRLWRNGLIVDVVTVPVMVDGENPVSADLSNEMDAVSCTADGKYLYGLPIETTVSMWSGTKKLELKSIELDFPEGVAGGYDIATGKITVTDVTDQAAPVLPIGISVSANFDGVIHTRNLTFTVNKQNQGETGALYKLVPSATDVKFNQSQTEEFAQVSCGVTWYDGREVSEVSELPEGMFMSYAVSGGEEFDYILGNAVSVSVSLSDVTFRLYKGGVLLDVETVPVVIDGSSPVTASIENEMDSIACTADGAYVYGLPIKTMVGMWYGTESLLLDELSVSAPDGVTCLTDSNTGEVSVTEVSDKAPKVLPVTIIMKATKFNVQHERSVVLTVNKQTQGEAGALYRLVATPDVVKVDKDNASGEYAVSSRVTWYNGKEVTEYTSDTFPGNMRITYSVGNDSETSYTYGEEILVASDASKVMFRLYMDSLLLDVETVPVILDGNSAFKSTVFFRNNAEPAIPTGGSYNNPTPVEDGWQDGIPDGEEILWASSRIFSIDGLYPQEDTWSKPAQMTSTSGFKVMYCELQTNPGTPDTKPNYWSEDSSTDTWWMATNVMTNGVWSGWKVSQIKGEKGEAGTQGEKGEKGEQGESGADAHRYSISPEAFTIGVNSAGSLEPSTMTFTCYDDTGVSSRETETAYWYVYGSNSGEDGDYTLITSYTSYVSSYEASFSLSYKYYRIKAKPYTNIECIANGAVVRDGTNVASGSMPYNCGEYDSDKYYYYNADRRDIVAYNGGVYMVKSFDADGYVYNKLPTNDIYWVQASKDIFRAMDTALIDGANIAGFTFKDNVMQSQTGTLTLDGVNGEITATKGSIGGFVISSNSITSESGAYNGGSGLNNFPDSQFFLYASGSNSANLGYSSTYRVSSIGLNTYPNLSNSAALGMFTDTQVPENYQDKIGLYISIEGGSIYSSGYQRNSALYIPKGHIAGYRRRLHRTAMSILLNVFDGVIVCTHTSGSITITLPSDPEDGQEYWMISANQKEVKVAVGSSSHTITRTGSSFSSDRWHVYVFDAYNKQWLYSYMNY